MYNPGFRKTKKHWHEIMITIDEDFDFSDDLVKSKIFTGGSYMTMETNKESLINTWKELSNWMIFTKTKAGRHQWVEEWLLDDWKCPPKEIKVFYPIKE